MKILTINTHSLIEEKYEQKLDIFTDAIYRIRPDIIAMQEVNQTGTAPVAALGKGFDVRCDNHVLRVCEALCDLGLEYRYFWHGIKSAYGRLQEGIAIMTCLPVSETDSIVISKKHDASDWRTRYALGVCVSDAWFYCIHTGRYDDEYDPFSEQWRRFTASTADKSNAWVMGDFNCDSENAGYREVVESGWYDTFCMANERDSGVTVKGNIDGWRDGAVSDMRIDYIFTNRKRKIKSSKVIFNGVNEKMISDHYGVLAEVQD